MDNWNQETDRERNTKLFAVLCQVLRKEPSPAAMPLTPDEFDVLLKLSKQHEVQPIAAYGLLLAGGLTKEQELRCRGIVYRTLAYHERMERELSRTCSLLEEARIPYMPLKGAVIRKLYPEPWLRTSGDIDILVRNVDEAEKWLSEHGYSFKEKSSHDVTLISPEGMILELHYQLIDTDLQAVTVLEQVWEYAVPREGTHHYEMEPECFYLYHIAHMVKHLVGRGCGIRFFADIWLMTETLPMDKEKKCRLLQNSGLLTFAEQAELLSQAWFGDRQPDAYPRELEAFVLMSGIFGNVSSKLTLNRAKTDNVADYFVKRIFKPYDKMVLKYPILRKYPVLLPVFWIRRLAEYLLSSRKFRLTIQEISENNGLDREQIAAAKRLLQELELL